MQDKRTEVRMLCADMIEISWNDDNGKTRRMMGLLEDISPRGACVQIECPLPIGTAVTFGSPEQQFRGPVRYCVYQDIGFFAGVEFEGRTWSERTFQPQHLLDPRKLAAARDQAKPLAGAAGQS